MNGWLKRASLGAILLMPISECGAVVPAASGQPPATKPKTYPYQGVPATDELYLRFREYRLALADASANVSPFFSREYLEWDMGSFLRKASSRDAEADNRVVRGRMRIGSMAVVVHSIWVRDESAGGRTLKLRIDSPDAKKIWSVELTFVREQGALRISKFGIDSTRPNEVGDDAVVERFAPAPE